MPSPTSGLAPGHAPPPLAAPHLVPLAGEWALWRDIAVRTAGFPVSGLAIFGSPDEQAGLRAVACDPLFRAAVTWQNRAAMRNAVANIAAGAAAPGSRQLRRAAAGLPGQPARFTEMLPGPDDCWLADHDGQRYTSELRLIAVDLERRASRRSEHSRLAARVGSRG